MVMGKMKVKVKVKMKAKDEYEQVFFPRRKMKVKMVVTSHTAARMSAGPLPR